MRRLAIAYWLVGGALATLAACAPPTVIVQVEVTATASPSPSLTPLPTWTPTPLPTPTPVPPAEVRALLPDRVSPLSPVPIEAEFVSPPGVSVGARLSAVVMDPASKVYAAVDLPERSGDRFRSLTPLQLPLEPLPGYWWLIVHAESELAVSGQPARYFEVEPVAFRELTGTLPSGVGLRVPAAFQEVNAQGDPQAGGRIWQHRDGEVGLWWAPGPTEQLLFNTAIVALEASQSATGQQDGAPLAREYFETEWKGLAAFEFPEAWPGPTGGPGRAWVIQGPDDWLYILRVRALGRDSLPQLHLEVAGTLSIAQP